MLNFTSHIVLVLSLISSLLTGQETGLVSNAHFLIDSTQQHTFESVERAQNFLPLSSDIRVKPDHPVWLKVTNLKNSDAKYLSVGNFDLIKMQVEGEEKILLNGRLTPLKNRIINGFPILFPLSLNDMGKTIYFKIEHKNPLAQERVQLTLLTEKERNENLRQELSRHNKEVLFTGSLIGLFMIFLFFSIMAYVFTKKHYYAFYSFYIISNLVLLLVSAERFANLDLFFSRHLSFLIDCEPLLFALIGVSYNLFLKKLIVATREIKWASLVFNCFIIYEILLYFFTPYLQEISNHHYLTYKLHEVGLITLFASTAYFLYSLFKSGNVVLKLIAGGLFLIFWGGPCLYFISKLGENQTFFLNPNMPFHLLMIAELIFFTLILGNEEYQAQIALEQEKADLKYRLSDVEKAALQAQMHPHFISNCLTSIQKFVVQNDRKKAVRYLSKFSRLVRHNLHASVDGVLTIKEEVDFLDIYLTLEKQRFNDAFDYKISRANSVDLERIKIAPLLIQPYVENAILHGMAAIEGDGMINIDFLLEDKTLIIRVKDNGIGINTRQQGPQKSSKHKSVGMTITHDRLALLDYGEKVEIRDLSDLNPAEQGTEVSIYIKIPDYE